MDDFKKKVGKDIKRNIDSVRNMRGKTKLLSVRVQRIKEE